MCATRAKFLILYVTSERVRHKLKILRALLSGQSSFSYGTRLSKGKRRLNTSMAEVPSIYTKREGQ
jgi:hypothetical protein